MSTSRKAPPPSLSKTPSMPPQPVARLSDDNTRVTAQLPSGESIEILLYGATIVSWKDAKGDEKLWLSDAAVLDGSKAVRGGVPLVFPVFGKSSNHPATDSLPQHGFARTSRWEFLGKSTTESESEGRIDNSIKLDFGLGPQNLSDEAKAAWKGNFGLIYSVTLSKDSLRTSMLVRNEGGEAWEFMVLMHTYLRVENIEATTVHGLQGVPYIDKLLPNHPTIASSDVLSFSSEVDRVYTPKSIDEKVTVSVSGTPTYEVTREELKDVVVWNPWIEKSKGMADFEPKEGYKNMLCVEAGSVKEWTKLEGGESWEGGVTIRSLL